MSVHAGVTVGYRLSCTPGAPASHDAAPSVDEHAGGSARSTLYISQLLPGLPGPMMGMSTPNKIPGGTACDWFPVFEPCATRPMAVARMPVGVVISRPAAGRLPEWHTDRPHLLTKMGSTVEQKSTAVAPTHAPEPVDPAPAA